MSIHSAGTESGKPKFAHRHHDAIVASVILVPMIAWWVVAFGFPLLCGFVLGFFEWKAVNQMPVFIGLENFITFFTSSSYLGDLWRTIWMGVLSTALIILTGLGSALVLNMKWLKGRGFFRCVWYLPAVTSSVAVTQVINILFHPLDGAVNRWLESMSLEPIVFSSSPGWSIAIIMVYSVWKGVGGAAIVWLAGLQSIDAVLYEAAKIDGASTFERFRYITLPGLRPIATYVIITGIISALQIYEPVAFLTNGGPNGATNVLSLRIIQDGYFNFNFGMAGASAFVLAVIIFATSVTYYQLSTRASRKEDS